MATTTPIPKPPKIESAPARRNSRWSGYRQLLWVRIIELKREPEVVFWVFIFPLLLAAGLGIAFRNKPADITSVVVIDNAGAQKVLAMLQGSSDKGSASRSVIRAAVLDRDAALKAFHFGKYDLAVESKPDGSYTYYYDPARPESVLSQSEIDGALQAAAGRKDAVVTSSQSSSEPGSRYIDFLIPGLVGLNLMSSSRWGIGYSIVEMRTKKLVKRLLATPMRKSDFLLSFVGMRALFVAVEVPVLFGFGWIAFGVRIFGSPLLLLALSFLGAFTFAGLGLLVASRAQNTQTVGGLMNLVMMPMFIASGVFFSTSNFPDGMQPVLRALPLTALNDSLRAVASDGASARGVARPIFVLAAWGIASYAGALKLFRWR